jgi:choline-sulfatase
MATNTAADAEAGGSRPNVLWICTDQQRYDTVGALGYDAVTTPTLDGLADEGVAFERAYCQSPVCTPSRASFLTGCYPSSVHGCMNGNAEWSGGATLLPRMFADAGYDCGLVGKFHLAGNDGQVESRGDGYDVFEWCHAPRDEWGEANAYANWLAAKGHDLGDLRDSQAERLPADLHYTTWCTETAGEFVREREDDEQPWLLSVNLYDPHPPFNPPAEYSRRYDPAAVPGPQFRPDDLDAQERLAPVDFQTEPRPPEQFDAREKIADYYAMIELLDERIGRLLDELERTGQRENTVVVFMSDHGEMLGDHGLLQKGCRFYEGLVRVPLIVSHPRQFETGHTSDALVELADVAPTLLESCGVDGSTTAERFGGMAGESLVPLLEGRGRAGEHRSAVRCEYYHALNPDASGRDPDVRFGTMLRTDGYKLVVYHGHDTGELFDLEADPHEFENRWDDPDYRDVREELLRRNFDRLALAVDRGPAQVGRY